LALGIAFAAPEVGVAGHAAADTSSAAVVPAVAAAVPAVAAAVPDVAVAAAVADDADNDS